MDSRFRHSALTGDFHISGKGQLDFLAASERIRGLRIAQRGSSVRMTRLLLQVSHMTARFQSYRD